MAIKTWPPKFLAGYNEGKPCGRNFCFISTPSLLLKYPFMHHVSRVLVPAQHFAKTNYKEIVEVFMILMNAQAIESTLITVSIYN